MGRPFSAEHLWRSLRRTVDPRVVVRVGPRRLSGGVFGLRLLSRKWPERARGLGFGFDVLEVLQTHHLPALSSAGQQHRGVPAEPGAHAAVYERVVKAGGLGEETGDDAGDARHVEAPRRPHGHHRIW